MNLIAAERQALKFPKLSARNPFSLFSMKFREENVKSNPNLQKLGEYWKKKPESYRINIKKEFNELKNNYNVEMEISIKNAISNKKWLALKLTDLTDCDEIQIKAHEKAWDNFDKKYQQNVKNVFHQDEFQDELNKQKMLQKNN